MSGLTTGQTSLQLQSFETLVQNSAAAMQGASTVPLDLDPGSVIRALLEADASQGLWLQYLVLLVLATARLSTSSGSDCDSFGADFGFTREPAVASTGTVTFSRFTATNSAFIPVYIPASGTVAASGTQVLTADGTQTFNVTADPTNQYYVASPVEGYQIPAGTASISVPAQAAVAGTTGNVLANTITLIVGGISGVDTVTNPSAFTNGVNAESDSAFKARFVNFVNSRSQGTETAVGYAIQQLQQGLTWTIQENQTANGTYTPGTFVVTVDDGTGSPSAALISTANAAVQAVRPITSTAIVQGPVKITANVAVTLTIQSGVTAANVIAAVGAAIPAYINALSVGETLSFYRLSQVIFDASPYITNISGLTLNSGTSDLTATPGQVIRAGTVTVN